MIKRSRVSVFSGANATASSRLAIAFCSRIDPTRIRSSMSRQDQDSGSTSGTLALSSSGRNTDGQLGRPYRTICSLQPDRFDLSTASYVALKHHAVVQGQLRCTRTQRNRIAHYDPHECPCLRPTPEYNVLGQPPLRPRRDSGGCAPELPQFTY